MNIHISPPSWAPLPPTPHPTSLSWVPSWASCMIQQLPTSSYLIDGSVLIYMSMLLSRFVPPSPSLCLPVSSPCLHFYSFPAKRFISTIFLDSVCMCCCCSASKSRPTLCYPMDCTIPGFPVLHHLLKFAQIQVYWVGDAIQPSPPLSSPSPPAFYLLSISIRVFSNESARRIRWPEYWSFSFSISPSSEYSGLISFRLTSLISLCPRFSQESSPAPQFKSISSSVLSLLYGPTLTSVHDYWESHSFDYTDLCWQSDGSAVICINIRHVLFSFWFTLLCITGCRFVHLTTTDSNSVFKWLSNTHLSFLSESFLIYSLHLP